MTDEYAEEIKAWRPALTDPKREAQIEILKWAIKVTADGHTYMMIRQIFQEKIKELEGK